MRRVALAPGSTLAASVRAATMMTSASELRAWAHDILEVPPDRSPSPSDERPQADRRVAAAILDFLREQPVGDGFALRAWIAANNPFNTPADADGVELLTFHAAKGREWHTVVVSGVETGLVPHRSAMTVDARAEEARLLHVAITRASDELIVTRAERRRGYARQASPLAVGLTTGPDPVVAAPADIKAPADPVRRRADTLVAWRRSAARASAMLAEQICSDDDLLAIAATPPSTPDELSAITGFGPIAATRLFHPIRAALDAASSAPDLD